MSWSGVARYADWDRDVLWGIVAMLFALAGLADRAAGAPARRRREVLEFLLDGESAARAFIIGMATGAPADDEVPESACLALDPMFDAERLAASLRALALVLCVIVARMPGPGGAAATLPTPRNQALPAGLRRARRRLGPEFRKGGCPPSGFT